MKAGPLNYDVTLPRYSTRAGAYIARVYAERNMNASVRIWRPDSPDFMPSDGKLYADEMFQVYEGKARVYTVSGPLTMGVGDEPTYYSSTMVSIPLALTDPYSSPELEIPQSPRVDDVVQVTSHPDPLMMDRYFRVVDVEAGSQFPVTRRMQCVGIQASKQWGKPDIPTEWIIR
jgi:hypothetical protein